MATINAHTKGSKFTSNQNHALKVAQEIDRSFRALPIGRVQRAQDVLVSDALGKITHWESEKGYGFIRLAEGQNLPPSVRDVVFCHASALVEKTIGFDVVSFKIVAGKNKCEASSVHKKEHEFISSGHVGTLMGWNEIELKDKTGENKSHGWIQSNFDNSWVYCCGLVDGNAWLGSLVEYDIERSHFDGKYYAANVRPVSGTVVAEDVLGRITYMNRSVGYISLDGEDDIQFAHEDLVDPDLHKGSWVSFTHKKVGDTSFATNVGRSIQPTRKIHVPKVNARWQGWVSRTFKTKDDAKMAVIVCFDHNLELNFSHPDLCLGDIVEFDAGLRMVNLAKVGFSFTTPLCKCGARHLLLRCPIRKVNKYQGRSKSESDRLSSCSTDVPASELVL